jgi:hypothetical protein
MDGKRKYSLENLQIAIKILQNQSILCIYCSSQNNISEATICYQLKNCDLFLYCGPFSLFKKKEKKALVDHVNYFSFFGLKISFSELISKIEKILKIKGSTKVKLERKWWKILKNKIQK